MVEAQNNLSAVKGEHSELSNHWRHELTLNIDKEVMVSTRILSEGDEINVKNH